MLLIGDNIKPSTFPLEGKHAPRTISSRWREMRFPLYSWAARFITIEKWFGKVDFAGMVQKALSSFLLVLLGVK